MPVAQIFASVSTDQIVELSAAIAPGTQLPVQTLVGVYITGTLAGANMLTEVQHPLTGEWMAIEDLSWRASYPDGSQNPLPPDSSDGATYLVINWKFRFQIQNASEGTDISVSMNW